MKKKLGKNSIRKEPWKSESDTVLRGYFPYFWWTFDEFFFYISYHMSFSSSFQFHANIKKICCLAPFTTLYCALLCEELETFTGVGRDHHIFVQGGGGEFGIWQNIYPWRLPKSQCHSLQFCNILSKKNLHSGSTPLL